jgi:hypothetical protein
MTSFSTIPICFSIDRSGRKVSLPDLNSVRMQRPVAKRLGFAELSLGQFGGVTLAGGVNFHDALADLGVPAVITEHVLHESNDKSRHGTFPSRAAPRQVHIALSHEEDLIGINKAGAAARKV